MPSAIGGETDAKEEEADPTGTGISSSEEEEEEEAMMATTTMPANGRPSTDDESPQAEGATTAESPRPSDSVVEGDGDGGGSPSSSSSSPSPSLSAPLERRRPVTNKTPRRTPPPTTVPAPQAIQTQQQQQQRPTAKTIQATPPQQQRPTLATPPLQQQRPTPAAMRQQQQQRHRHTFKFRYDPPEREREYYRRLFHHANNGTTLPPDEYDDDESVVLPPERAAGLFLLAGLSTESLRMIWNMAVMPSAPYPPGAKPPPAMTAGQFRSAVRLIQLFQNGRIAVDDRLRTRDDEEEEEGEGGGGGMMMSPAHFAGVTGVIVPPPPMAMAVAAGRRIVARNNAFFEAEGKGTTTAAGGGGGKDAGYYAMSDADATSHRETFSLRCVAAGGGRGHPSSERHVYVDEAVALFSSSSANGGSPSSPLRLSRGTLGRLWDLAAVSDPNSGKLDEDEFVLMAHLVDCVKNRGLEVPGELPASLRAWRARNGGGGEVRVRNDNVNGSGSNNNNNNNNNADKGSKSNTEAMEDAKQQRQRGMISRALPPTLVHQDTIYNMQQHQQRGTIDGALPPTPVHQDTIHNTQQQQQETINGALPPTPVHQDTLPNMQQQQQQQRGTIDGAPPAHHEKINSMYVPIKQPQRHRTMINGAPPLPPSAPRDKDDNNNTFVPIKRQSSITTSLNLDESIRSGNDKFLNSNPNPRGQERRRREGGASDNGDRMKRMERQVATLTKKVGSLAVELKNLKDSQVRGGGGAGGGATVGGGGGVRGSEEDFRRSYDSGSNDDVPNVDLEVYWGEKRLDSSDESSDGKPSHGIPKAVPPLPSSLIPPSTKKQSPPRSALRNRQQQQRPAFRPPVKVEGMSQNIPQMHPSALRKQPQLRGPAAVGSNRTRRFNSSMTHLRAPGHQATSVAFNGVGVENSMPRGVGDVQASRMKQAQQGPLRKNHTMRRSMPASAAPRQQAMPVVSNGVGIARLLSSSVAGRAQASQVKQVHQAGRSDTSRTSSKSHLTHGSLPRSKVIGKQTMSATSNGGGSRAAKPTPEKGSGSSQANSLTSQMKQVQREEIFDSLMHKTISKMGSVASDTTSLHSSFNSRSHQSYQQPRPRASILRSSLRGPNGNRNRVVSHAAEGPVAAVVKPAQVSLNVAPEKINKNRRVGHRGSRRASLVDSSRHITRRTSGESVVYEATPAPPSTAAVDLPPL